MPISSVCRAGHPGRQPNGVPTKHGMPGDADCQLGWDITDFGNGFAQRGRHCSRCVMANSANMRGTYLKSYAEKIMVVGDQQKPATFTSTRLKRTSSIVVAADSCCNSGILTLMAAKPRHPCWPTLTASCARLRPAATCASIRAISSGCKLTKTILPCSTIYNKSS